MFSNTTEYYNLPQFAENDILTWNDLNTAFHIIDSALHTLSLASGVTENQVSSMIESAMSDVIKYEANGTGITNNQFSHLTIVGSE